MNNFLTQLSAISLIDWFAMVTGIFGVYLSIKERILAWPLFILCYAAYVYISFRGNYYAFGGMNVIFVFVAAYGWLKWSNSSRESGGEIRISHLATAHRWIVAGFICVGTLGSRVLAGINRRSAAPLL
jgi:nicotinamide mononucleotide transporter